MATCRCKRLHLLVVLCGVCGTQGVIIINCNNNNNNVEIFQDSPAPVTCGDITSTADVYWRRGDEVNIGECSAAGTCTSNYYNDYRLSRSPQSTESQLTLVPDYRRHAGLTVTCQDRLSDSTASCTLVIKRRSVLSECHVTNNPVDWTVSGSCRVQQAFSSDNIYTCTWTRSDGPTFGGFDASRELCSFTQALPQAGGLYTYNISVSPPATTTFSHELRLGARNVSVVSTTDSLSPSSDSIASSASVIGPIVGSVVAVVVIAVIGISLVIFIRRRRRHSKKETAQYQLESHEEPGLYAHFTPPADNHGYEDLIVNNTIEDGTTTQMSAAIMYENTQRLTDQTYDTPCKVYEDHQYTDVKVRTTQSVKATKKACRPRKKEPASSTLMFMTLSQTF